MNKLAEQLKQGDTLQAGTVTYMDAGTMPARTVHTVALVLLGSIEALRIDFDDGTYLYLPPTHPVTTEQ